MPEDAYTVECQHSGVCLGGSSYTGYPDNWGLSTSFSCVCCVSPFEDISSLTQNFLAVSVAQVQTNVVVICNFCLFLYYSGISLKIYCFFFFLDFFKSLK